MQQEKDKEIKAYQFKKPQRMITRKEKREKSLIRQTKQQNGNDKSFPINKYFKCKLIKFPNQKK